MTGLPLGWRIFANGTASLVIAFLVLPILIVIPASFNRASFIRIPPQEYSTLWYQRFVDDPQWLSSLINSVQVALIATLLAVSLGTLASLGLRRLVGRTRIVLIGLFLAPLIVPIIVIAIAMYRSSLDVGLNSTLIGIALGHTVLALPFVVINVSLALRGLHDDLLRAASGLGAGPMTIFRTITLPVIMPGVVGGAIFSFMTSFDEVVIAVFMAGYSSKTLPVKTWEAIRLEFTPVIAVAATIMILFGIMLIVAAQLASRRTQEQAA